MTLKRFPVLSSMFSPSMVQLLVNLRELEIVDCNILEYIPTSHFFEVEDEIRISEVQRLVLRDLPRLPFFFPRPRFFERTLGGLDIAIQLLLFERRVAFPNLEVLVLDGLPNFESMEQVQLGVQHLCALRRLILLRLSNLKYICQNDPRPMLPANLKHLTVDSCGMLRNLFHASMIGQLEHLRELRVNDCSMLEEIIAGKEEQGQSVGTTLLPQLDYLHLQNLPRLTSFCKIKYYSEFPLLKTVTVLGCPKMRILSPRFLSTSKFVSLTTDDINYSEGKRKVEKDSLNDSLYKTIIERGRKGAEIAWGVAMVALRGFITIDWNYYMELLPEGGEKFKLSVFKAITKFILGVYDLEDFEHVVDIEKINKECEEFIKLCKKSGDDPLTAISRREMDMDLKRLSMTREQDIGNILEWWYQRQPQIHDKMDRPENIGSFAVEPCGLNFHYIVVAIQCLKEYVPMKEKDKMHLWKELKECKCLSTLDAWYMESWREIMKIQDVQNHVHEHIESAEKLEDLVSDILNVFYDLAATKIAGLRKCQRLVIFPLISNVFGKWKDEVIEVVRCAEIERRSEGCRFVGVNHLLSSLRWTNIQESIEKLQLESYIDPKLSVEKLHLKPSVDPEPSVEKPHVDPEPSVIPKPSDEKLYFKPSIDPEPYPVYHIYKSSHDIARALGDREIGLEHLYLAIVFGGNGIHKIDWEAIARKQEVQDFAKSKSGGDNGETSSEVINLWSHFLEEDECKKRHLDGNVLPLVIRIQEKLESGFSPLKEVERK